MAAARLPAVMYDIDNWDDLDVYYRTQAANNLLAQKGFCIIRGNLEKRVKTGAQREARKYRKESALTRVPREALSSLLGETASCWTKELTSPETEVVPPEQQCLRKVDKRLHDIGMNLASAVHLHCNMSLMGRLAGVLHHSKMPEDRPAPKLIDLDEAIEYMDKAMAKKVSLLCFLGPSPATLTIAPRENPKKAYEVTIKDDTIIVYRNDACTVSYATRGFAISVQIDFIARMRAGLREGPRDSLPLPTDLGDWYDQRLMQAAQSRDENFDYLPLDFVRDAKLSYFSKEPVVVGTMWYDLPSVPVPGEAGLTQIQAIILAGQDVVTEIASPSKNGSLHYPLQMPVLSGAKWEIDEYYDADPLSEVEYKVYTKHLSVLSRNTPSDCPSFLEFGLTYMEDASLDHRARMLYEAHYCCHTKALMDREDLVRKELGFFVGVSGMSMNLFFKREAKLNKFTMSGLSHSSMVSRLPYYFDSKGPAQAVDAEDASGACALQQAVQYLSKPQGEHGPYAFASAVSYIDGPMETIVQCAAGVISHSGRSRTFDESADGFVKGEAAICFMLQPMIDEDGHNVNEKVAKPTIQGSAMNSKGQSASLTAPNGPAIIDVVRRAARDATIPFSIIDAMEANAGGNPLADLMELGAIREALHPEGSERNTQAVPMRSMKSTYGNLGAPNGLVAVARTCALLERGLHGPNLHLHQLVDTSALHDDGEGEFISRMHFLSEVIESKVAAQFVGVSSFGSSMNVHTILWGTIHSEHNKQYAGKALTWWPGEDVATAKQPMLGYYIVGTMTAWETTVLMESEGEGVYGYTLTMGENNWECFQIWIDRDQEKVLHPTQARSWKETKLVGPDGGVGKELCWCVSGITRTVRLINEEQCLQIKTANEQAVANGLEPPTLEYPCAVTFPDDGKPQGYENAQGVEDMPLIQINQVDAGKPGDKYRIRLHVRGKYKRLEWTKATGLDALTAPAEEPFVHEYKIIGDHNYWVFEPMTLDSSEPGLYTTEIHLLKDKTNFQIYRDGDWEQGFYPASPAAGSDVRVEGPDERGHGLNWQISGKVGDIYRIQWRRRAGAEGEARSISWDFVRSEEVDFQKLAEKHTYYIVGTWNNFKESWKMFYDKEEKRYRADIRISGKSQESFQILLNSNWLSAVHPSFNDANNFIDDGHTMEGPDDGGVGKYWTVGLHPEEGVTFGDSVTIYMDTSNGLPSRVWWEAKSDIMSHQIKLANGCKNIFYRHCRLMDIPAFATPYTPAECKGRIKVPELNPHIREYYEEKEAKKKAAEEAKALEAEEAKALENGDGQQEALALADGAQALLDEGEG